MKTKNKSYQAWKWSLVVLAFFSLVVGDFSLAKAKPALAQALPPEGLNIVSFAGFGVFGFSGDNGPAVAAQFRSSGAISFDLLGNAYITDVFNQRIRRVDTAGIITTVVGTGVACNVSINPSCGDGGLATNAQLNTPRGTAVDSAGNLYIADLGNSAVRFVNLGTTPTTILGLTVQPGHITTIVGAPGDIQNCASTQGGPPTWGETVHATQARICTPAFPAFDNAGNLYISDVAGQRFYAVNLGTTDTTILGQLVPPEHIRNIVGTGVGCNLTTHPSCGDGGSATSAQLNAPNGMDFDSSGNLYIADVANHAVRRVDTSGIITTVAGILQNPGFFGDGGDATSAKLNNPRTVAIDPSNDLWIADFSNQRIRFVNLGATATSISGQTVEAGHITTLAGNGTNGISGDGGPALAAEFMGPNHITFDSAGNPYIGEGFLNPPFFTIFGSRVRRLNLATPVVIGPGTLNVNSKGQWITATLQFPTGRDASEVNFDSVMLQAINLVNSTSGTVGTVRVLNNEVLQTTRDPAAPMALNDTNNDGMPDQLVLKFDRGTVASWATGDPVLVLRVEGRFQDGRYFSGDTSVNIVQ